MTVSPLARLMILSLLLSAWLFYGMSPRTKERQATEVRPISGSLTLVQVRGALVPAAVLLR